MAIYVPREIVPTNTDQLSYWLLEEVRRIGEASSAPYDSVRFNPLNKALDRPRDGLTAYFTSALATTLGLVGGEGVYSYINGQWIPLHDGVGNFVFVDSVDRLPAAVAGVRTLAADTAYYFTKFIDLNGDRLVGSSNTTILGTSSESARIYSTGLNSSTALITSEYSLPVRNISLKHGTALNLDAGANPGSALDWYGVNFVDCDTIGTIADYNNALFFGCAFLNSAGLTFDGTIGTVGLNQCILTLPTNGTFITIPSTATISRRFRIIYSALVGATGGTVLNVSTSASIPVEGYILDTVNFSGSGTYMVGVQYDDNKALVKECRGVDNSASVANYYMVGNATATTIGATTTPVKVAGTTTEVSITQKFTHTNNRATYDGALNRTFKATANLSLTSGNNNQISVYFYLNGSKIAASETDTTTSGAGRAENVFCHTITELSQTDYLEVWVENNTATNNITVENLNVIIEALN